jgi:hypothetical protein
MVKADSRCVDKHEASAGIEGPDYMTEGGESNPQREGMVR